MEIKKKRDVYQIIASGGFLFCAVFRFLYMFLSGWYEEVGYAWYNDEASLLTWAYASIAFVILFCPNNGSLFGRLPHPGLIFISSDWRMSRWSSSG